MARATISTSLPPLTIHRIDLMCEDGEYNDRSHAIEMAVENTLLNENLDDLVEAGGFVDREQALDFAVRRLLTQIQSGAADGWAGSGGGSEEATQ